MCYDLFIKYNKFREETIMNLRKLYNIVNKDWPRLGFEVKEETRDGIRFGGSIQAEDYFDDGVLVSVFARNNGAMDITYTFDELDRTLENYELINEFNDNVPYFKAYICPCENSCYFELSYHHESVAKPDEKEFAEIVSLTLSSIISEGTMEYLHPITERTY